MKTTISKLRQTIRNVIKESMPRYSAPEIYMDIMRRGGPDKYVAIAHERPGMRCTDPMHYEHALRAYIDEEAPHLLNMPNNVWNQICKMLRETV